MSHGYYSEFIAGHKKINPSLFRIESPPLWLFDVEL
jgi:hypothetical protein